MPTYQFRLTVETSPSGTIQQTQDTLQQALDDLIALRLPFGRVWSVDLQRVVLAHVPDPPPTR